jgi:hypothetical protein
MNPNDPHVSRALAKLKNHYSMETSELIDLAKRATDLTELRKEYARRMNFYLKDVPKLP